MTLRRRGNRRGVNTNLPHFVALLQISGKVEGAKVRLQKLPAIWKGVKLESVVLGTGGYDAVVSFLASSVEEGIEFINANLRGGDPLTLIDTVTGERLFTPESI